MPVKKGNHGKHHGPADPVNDKQGADLIAVQNYVAVTAEHRNDCRRHELERIDIKQHREQQNSVHDQSVCVAKCVATEHVGVCDPDEIESREAEGEWYEAAQVVLKLREITRHFQAYNQQCCSKREHGVGERLDPCGFVLACGNHVSARASASDISPDSARSSATAGSTVSDSAV